MTQIKVKKLKVDLTGMKVPKDHASAGMYVENLLISRGYQLQKGYGADLKEYNVEVKTRDKDATSPHTIGSMQLSDIIKKDYDASVVKEKMQQQFRVITKDQIIIKNYIVDFSSKIVQEKIREAYELGRNLLAHGYMDSYIPGSYWGFFERKKKSNSYTFRITDTAMKQLEDMSNLTYNNIFEEQND